MCRSGHIFAERVSWTSAITQLKRYMPPRKRGAKATSSKPGPRKRSTRAQSQASATSSAEAYRHRDAELATRPEIGTQAQFRKKKAPKTYEYDPSLSPSLQWAGKAERLSFEVPTLPMFVHERLSTSAILETLKRHRRDKQEALDLFGDPEHSVADQVLRAYEHRDQWVNRAVLGDSLVVMNSLLEYEGLGGQVQTIYIDPPYGVKFGSNFQPFVRKRDVKHNDDAHFTREPEMVQAYRDTWELGIHSYLTYLRDRLLVARELLTPSGSVFVQISDENLHHVKELLDEVFGSNQAIALVTVVKTSAQEDLLLPSVCDYLLWYARDAEHVKYRPQWLLKNSADAGVAEYNRVQLGDGSRRRMTAVEERDWGTLPPGSRPYRQDNMVSQRPPGSFPVEFEGRVFRPITGYWKTGEEGMQRLLRARRLEIRGTMLSYVRFFDDFVVRPLANFWSDVRFSSRSEAKVYAVQTSAKMVERCLLMTTDPGDLVLDPTCGSGTTAYVAEQWGRRWITIDTSRVPLALTRQRILTATFPWYELREPERGPAGGFVYERKQNHRGEEVGGIVPHVTLKSIANDEPPKEEVLVDRPNVDRSITRVSGPFVVEATIPTPVDFEGDGAGGSGSPQIAAEHGSFVERMMYVLQKSPVLQVGGGKTVTLRNVRPPARTLSLSAEAVVDASAAGQAPSLSDVVDEAEERRGDRLALSGKPVAIVFGPESGAVTEKLVFNAGREASAKTYTHLYVIGFAIQPTARETIEKSSDIFGVPATYVQATPDLMMGDLLKNMRSSQIFSVCGLPEIEIARIKPAARGEPEKFQVRLLGLDTFEPITMQAESLNADEVPAWFLDTSYDDLCFRVAQAFFPRTEAWKNLKRALAPDYEDSVWDHLHGTESAPFEAPADGKIAVKVIDVRGNELMVVKLLSEALPAK